MKTKLWLRLLFAFVLITIASAKRVRAEEQLCPDNIYGTPDGDGDCCNGDGSCCIEPDGTEDPSGCADGGDGSGSGWGSSCGSNQSPDCCDTGDDDCADPNQTSCSSNQELCCCDNNDDDCTCATLNLRAQYNPECSGNNSSCCCDPTTNNCLLGQSCQTGQTTCCCSNSNSTVSSCTGGPTFNWNPNNPCPSGQGLPPGQTFGNGKCGPCATGLTAVNGFCVPDCYNFPCETGCSNPCNVTQGCTWTPTAQGVSSGLLSGTGTSTTLSCCSCPTPSVPPGSSCSAPIFIPVPPATGSSPSSGE